MIGADYCEKCQRERELRDCECPEPEDDSEEEDVSPDWWRGLEGGEDQPREPRGKTKAEAQREQQTIYDRGDWDLY